jgi:hypothetical protein
MSFLDTHSLALPVLSMLCVSDDEYDRLSSSASHCCPNCDDDITVHEHEYMGVCSPCYDARSFN